MWGDVIREQKSDIASYRYGYQGQFAEKDDETRWNHFELREFDAVVGRWMSSDLACQYWSPYVGMGNDPVNEVDPDGAYSKFGAWWRNGFSMNGVYDVDGEWGYSKNSIIRFEDPDLGVFEAFEHEFVYQDGAIGRKFSKAANQVASSMWNSVLARFLVADYYVISGGANFGFGGYMGNEANIILMVRGTDPGVYVQGVTVFGVQTSLGFDATAAIGKGYFATLN